MNSIVLRVGAAFLLGAAILLTKWWSRRLREQLLLSSDMSYGNFDGSSTNTCYICLQDFIKKNFLSLPCKHKYHKECISLVFREVSIRRTCPVCRRVVPESFVSEVLHT